MSRDGWSQQSAKREEFSRSEEADFQISLLFISVGGCSLPAMSPKLNVLDPSLLAVPVTQPAAAAAKSHQFCPTLCGPIDGSPPGSPIPGILQARTLERVAISFSNEWKWKWSRSVMSNSATPWTAAYKAPPSMGFSRQEYWSGMPLPSPVTHPSLIFTFHFSQGNETYFLIICSHSV